MSYRWEMAVYTEDGEEPVPLAQYLQERATGRATWTPSLETSTVFLEAQGREWLASTWSLGDLGLMILQFETAAERLRRGLPALVRSAVDDASDVPFLMLDPVGTHEVLISLFFVDESQLRMNMPVPEDSARAKALYEYVELHRAHLLGPIQPGRESYSFRRVSFPYRELLESMDREAQLGRRLYALLDTEMPRI